MRYSGMKRAVGAGIAAALLLATVPWQAAARPVAGLAETESQPPAAVLQAVGQPTTAAAPDTGQTLAATQTAAPAPRSLSLAEAQDLAVAHDPQIELARLDFVEAELAVAALDDAPAGPRIVPPWEWASPYPWSLMQEQYARAAKESQLRLAELHEQHAVLGVRQTVEQLYLEVLSAEEKLKAAEASLASADSQLAAARAGERAGTVSRLELAQAEQMQRSAALGVTAAERQLQSARMALNSRIGLDLDTPLTLTTRFAEAKLPETDLAADIAQAERRRLELVTAREQTALAQLYFDNARKSFGEGSTLPTYAQAERDLARAELREQQQRSSIVLQVRQSYLSLLTAYEQLEAEQAAVAIAEQSFEASLVRLRAGLISQTAAAEAQANLTRARAAAAEALYRYNLALASYRQATGADLPEPGLD